MMTAHSTISPLRLFPLLGRRLALEFIRRKDFYVLFLFMALFSGGVVIFRAVGIEAPATGTFLLNLGLTLAWFAAHLLTLLMAGRLLPVEIERRTIYPLLARPLTRGAMLMNYWAACALGGVASWLILMMLAWCGVPKMESYNTILLAQMMALQIVSLAMLAALALAGSLFMPRAVNLLVVGGVWIGGGRLATMLSERNADGGMLGWLAAYIPDFSKLNLITRYTDGIGPVSGAELLGLAAYGAVFIAVALAAGAWAFNRKRL